jgi:hypothetical protein
MIYSPQSKKGAISLKYRLFGVPLGVMLLLWRDHCGRITRLQPSSTYPRGSLANGAENWKFESNPPARFRRLGVARPDFAKVIGQNITIEGVRARDGSLNGYLQKVPFPDVPRRCCFL